MSSPVALDDRVLEYLRDRGLLVEGTGAREQAVRELGLSSEDAEEFFGHGPLAPLLADESVTEILVNGPDEIWCEREGRLARHPGAFRSAESLRRYARRILGANGRKVDHRAPFADATLPCGARVHVAAPPVAKRGLCLSVRKFARTPWTLARLEELGALTAADSGLLRDLVRGRRNILVAGGTGTGKTSLLAALLGEAKAEERIVGLEDVAEIRTTHPHFLSLEGRPANQDGEGEICLPRLLREALRMRPDRLVVGECRGREAMDLLLALSTGHPGSLATIHANNPREALLRLEALALLAAENLREGAVKSLVCGGIHVILHLERTERGRRLGAVVELRGVDGGNYLLRDLRRC